MTTRSLDEIVNRVVSVEELQRALNDPISGHERRDALALHRWFTTRYPTAEGEARLCHAGVRALDGESSAGAVV